jgi:prepilin-type N-terminal cleavage/methylation domain-containing protein
MRPAPGRPIFPSRRGVTLLEMLVAVALLVLMMSILVVIFQQATGAIQEHRVYAALDQELRRLDSVIRRDLAGTTAKMTPPNNPADGTGYFEYAENALADSQGEDSDDTLRFTVKSPDGQPFIGRMWLLKSVPPSDPSYASTRAITYEPTTITSDTAEVVYFLRNGNLYRRVFLIAPQRVSSAEIGNVPSDRDPYGAVRPGPASFGFQTSIFSPLSAFSGGSYVTTAGGYPVVGWLGLNDISARPSDFPRGVTAANFATVLAANSYRNYAPLLNSLGDLTNRERRIFNPRTSNDFITNGTTEAIPDGLPDDENNMDGDPQPEGDGVADFQPVMYPNIGFLLNELAEDGVTAAPAPRFPIGSAPSPYDVLAFPYVYPNSYSQPASPFQATAAPFSGGIHSLDPSVTPVATAARPYFGTFLDPPYNHNPIDIGDSLATPGTGQTWWGFPTWRETVSPNWVDPIKRLNDPAAAPYRGLLLGQASAAEAGAPGVYSQSPGLSYRFLSGGGRYWLPPMDGTQVNAAQPFNDGSGYQAFADFFAMPPTAVWEEDLIASNVRSFDVKALDPSPKIVDASAGGVIYLPPGYYDLGYGNLLSGTPPVFLDSFAHEGRIPPFTTDFRADAQFPGLRGNIGDDTASVIRLRRVWDSWSTAYTNVPALPLIPNNGPLNGQMPVVPSYPAPYPQALRGIQIQIRVVDPSNQRTKTLTIRQDFTGKL